jgi:hypothetical protein
MPCGHETIRLTLFGAWLSDAGWDTLSSTFWEAGRAPFALRQIIDRYDDRDWRRDHKCFGVPGGSPQVGHQGFTEARSFCE